MMVHRQWGERSGSDDATAFPLEPSCFFNLATVFSPTLTAQISRRRQRSGAKAFTIRLQVREGLLRTHYQVTSLSRNCTA
ncbi:MAG: hypothetical protein CM15mP84_04960 [Cellvibrionales bacterium]|nr:MAG: hypothetical protein CM15mP84_04960 [Cellvibrionales bacterium]